MSEKRVNALRALAGGAAAIGGAIRSARLQEALREARQAERDVDDARDAYDTYMATVGPDPIAALRLQQAVNDAQDVFNESQRFVDSIQSEEALWAMAAGGATMLDGLGVGNGGGNGGGNGDSGEGSVDDFTVNGTALLTSAAAGFAGGAIADSVLDGGRRGRRRE